MEEFEIINEEKQEILQEEISVQENDQIEIPQWDLTPPFDGIDRGEM